jgi:methionyl-tRNA formyltransferase
LNLPASFLRRWRGAAPIHRAIESGDTQTGVTIMQMDEGLDTGDMLLCEALPIGPHDTTGQLHDRLARLGGRLIVDALELAACGGLRPVAQPAEGVTYAHKIDKAEGRIDWRLPADAIERRVRAFDPFPGASTEVGAEALKVWAARADATPHNAPVIPGEVLACNDAGVWVQCGQGRLCLTELQRPGGKRLPVAEFQRGKGLQAGDLLGASVPA